VTDRRVQIGEREKLPVSLAMIQRVATVRSTISVASRARVAWKDDKTLLEWLDAL
jgi:hypothetical protein